MRGRFSSSRACLVEIHGINNNHPNYRDADPLPPLMGTHIAFKLKVVLALLFVSINLAGDTVICLYHFRLGNFNFLLGGLGKWIILSLPPFSSVLGLSAAHAFGITNEVSPFVIHPQQAIPPSNDS